MARARTIRRAVGAVTRAASSGLSPVSRTDGRNRSGPAANRNCSVTPSGLGSAEASSIRKTGYSSRSRLTLASRSACTVVASRTRAGYPIRAAPRRLRQAPGGRHRVQGDAGRDPGVE